ncbi:putative serine protease F56F10.1 [Haliotis rubra]|uniref:putative serine protease F56F10.1 n=1 Tax=Haliotis rubra TaxID=36100 RepID=UPI001EE55C23|nr:putative serine protease F56F10.1 [Haliotis rubra]
MNTFLVCLFAVATCLAVEGEGFHVPRNDDDPSTAYPEQWFSQKLDHFNVVDTRYWKQRYYVVDQFYKPGGPVFLFVGPQEALTPTIFTGNGAWLEYAKTFHAIGFAVEHRFYGKSHPTPDLSVKSLQYLTIEQAMEDFATFIVATNKERNFTNPKWIAFGGSYSAMMSTWFRSKFPHLVAGAVADSAPVASPVFAAEYHVAIGDDLRTESGCYQAASDIFDEIRASLKTDAGVKKLQSLFRFCDFNASNKLDVENMNMYLLTLIGWTAIFNKDTPDTMSPLPVRSVRTMCKIFTDKTAGTPVERLASYAGIVNQNYTSLKGQCMNITFARAVSVGSDINYSRDDVLAGRQWRYQKCTHVGLFTPTYANNQPFGQALSEEYFLKGCEGYFGPEFNRSLVLKGHDELITNYAGLDVKNTNIVYTQGSFDPWYKYGFQTDPNPGATVIFINGGGHTPDMAVPAATDIAGVTQARGRIRQLIRKWISSGAVPIVG